VRYLDFIGLAGADAPAGEHTNVRADFSVSGAIVGALLASCTAKDSASFDADFRLAKSTDA
jgi:hypothetical protein